MRELTFLLIGFSLLFLASCGDDEVDNTPPQIDFLQIIPGPGSMEVCGEPDLQAISLMGGETLKIHARITDDIALSQVKTDIHPNFDCHGHRSISTDDWLVLELEDLKGTEVDLNLEIPVPEMVTAGFYHMQIRVVDQAGNTTPAADFWNLYVRNPHDTLAPTISITDAELTPTVISRAETLSLTTEVTDNKPFNFGGNARIELNYRRANSSNLFNAVDLELTGSDQSTITDVQFSIPQTLVTGDYLFFLTAYDGVNNESETIRMEIEIR